MNEVVQVVVGGIGGAVSVAGRMFEGMGVPGLVLAAVTVYLSVRVLIVPLVGYSGSSDKAKGKKEDK